MSEQATGKKIRPVAARGRKPVARSVLAKLVEDIASGRFAETTLLPSEAELSRRFEVSRTALREAMRHLVALGLIEPRTRAGTVVLPRSRWNRLDPMILSGPRQPDGIRLLQRRLYTLIGKLIRAAPQAVGGQFKRHLAIPQ